MLWIALAAVTIIGVIVREVSLAPEANDDYEVELWENIGVSDTMMRCPSPRSRSVISMPPEQAG